MYLGIFNQITFKVNFTKESQKILIFLDHVIYVPVNRWVIFHDWVHTGLNHFKLLPLISKFWLIWSNWTTTICETKGDNSLMIIRQMPPKVSNVTGFYAWINWTSALVQLFWSCRPKNPEIPIELDTYGKTKVRKFW